MLYDIRLHLHYDYAAAAGGGRHQVRVLPQTIAGVQRVIAASLSFAPAPAERADFSDFFGNNVTAIAFRDVHEEPDIRIAGLRGLGIPAGYVSGFVRTIPPKGKPRLEGADAMHAWVKAWCGRDAGWQEFDPTNGMRACNDHITVGYGRDYSDVAPIVGVLKTTGGQVGEQAVDVVPVAA